jgi:hypothetical protein
MEEIRLNKYRTIICFSVLFLTFFGGKFWFTDEIFGVKILKQQKIKYRYEYFNEFYYRNEWTKFRYKWQNI